jgi:hypothetical protein
MYRKLIFFIVVDIHWIVRAESTKRSEDIYIGCYPSMEPTTLEDSKQNLHLSLAIDDPTALGSKEWASVDNYDSSFNPPCNEHHSRAGLVIDSATASTFQPSLLQPTSRW